MCRPRCQYFFHILAKMGQYLYPQTCWIRLSAIFCIICLAAERAINVFVPIYSRNIVNLFKENPDLMSIRKAVIVFGVLTLLQGGIAGMGLIRGLQDFSWTFVQQQASRKVQLELVDHIHALPLRWHLDKKTGDVLCSIDRWTAAVSDVLEFTVMNLLPAVVDIIVAAVYVSCYINGLFMLILIGCMIFYIYVTVCVKNSNCSLNMNVYRDNTKSILLDSLNSFETVKYYNSADYELSRLEEVISNTQDEERCISCKLLLISQLQNVVTWGCVIGTVSLSAHCFISGTLKVEDYVQIMTYFAQFFIPLNYFGTHYSKIKDAYEDLKDMLDFLSEEKMLTDDIDAVDLLCPEGKLEFRNVSFMFTDGNQILRNVSFNVNRGQTTALVGLSGSGKSTIVRLLFRLFNLEEGCILIDNQDISKVKHSSLSTFIGVVPQDIVLFSGTIMENIRYGLRTASDQEVIAAAKDAGIHDRIMSFPNEYNTQVGERGLRLSAGERQQVAIARVILKSPPIILLDAALDTETDHNIKTLLTRVGSKKTTVVVTHRLSTIETVNMILVLKDGQIVEQGSHRELVSRNGPYSEMWTNRRQQS